LGLLGRETVALRHLQAVPEEAPEKEEAEMSKALKFTMLEDEALALADKYCGCKPGEPCLAQAHADGILVGYRMASSALIQLAKLEAPKERPAKRKRRAAAKQGKGRKG
jgi:hypothetical protein